MIRKLVVLLLVGVFSAALLLGYGAWKYDAALKQPLNLTQEQLLDVPAGATPTGTFNRLEADGVLDGAFWLRLYWRFNLDGARLNSFEQRVYEISRERAGGGLNFDYEWFMDNLPVPAHPRQYEFSRLNLNYTITSKRKLKQLVDEKHVNGWDDPRMSTILLTVLR